VQVTTSNVLRSKRGSPAVARQTVAARAWLPRGGLRHLSTGVTMSEVVAEPRSPQSPGQRCWALAAGGLPFQVRHTRRY
jgi:hypothetical protein